MSDQVNKYNPPYLSISKLIEMFNILSTRSFTTITADDFVNRGFSKTDSFIAVTALRFLGLINEQNEKTELLTKLQLKGEERIKGIQEIVQKAYNKLFDTAPQANLLQKDEIHNELVAIYGLSNRLAKPAVLAFIWLCAQGGLEVSVEPGTRNRKNVSRKPENAKEKDKTQIPFASQQIQIVDSQLGDEGIQAAELSLSYGKGKILVPLKLTEKDIDRLKKQIDLFAVEEDSNNGGLA